MSRIRGIKTCLMHSGRTCLQVQAGRGAHTKVVAIVASDSIVRALEPRSRTGIQPAGGRDSPCCVFSMRLGCAQLIVAAGAKGGGFSAISLLVGRARDLPLGRSARP